MTKSKEFLTITNKDIYERIGGIDSKLDAFCLSNEKEHARLSGKARLNFWVATTSITLILILIAKSLI